MRQIVIASHHRFAEGLRSTLEFVGGELGITSICAYVDDTPLERQIEEAFARFSAEDEVLILTDMLQGSVNQAFMRFTSARTFLVTGVNLPCALELALSAEPLSCELIEGCLKRAREQLVLVNTLSELAGTEDE